MTYRLYNMLRGGEVVAHVVTLPSGKCIVSWPTSTIVYDSETGARAVHITHMGGRGEQTEFFLTHDEGVACKATVDAQQDRWENAPIAVAGLDASALAVPDYVEVHDALHYVGGYARALYWMGHK